MGALLELSVIAEHLQHDQSAELKTICKGCVSFHHTGVAIQIQKPFQRLVIFRREPLLQRLLDIDFFGLWGDTRDLGERSVRRGRSGRKIILPESIPWDMPSFCPLPFPGFRNSGLFQGAFNDRLKHCLNQDVTDLRDYTDFKSVPVDNLDLKCRE